MKTKITIGLFVIVLIAIAATPPSKPEPRLKTFYSTNEAGLNQRMLNDIKEMSDAGYEMKAMSAWCKSSCFGITVMEKK